MEFMEGLASAKLSPLPPPPRSFILPERAAQPHSMATAPSVKKSDQPKG
jgi:hypothetical protein